ncbi:alkaline phosphatase [Photobacterium lipolyticum]|uniref:Alkaline phosphatase n=1 Tax=Photobacterium lipolyticum TaxID=266810 RepID=A0A2T3N1I7_9GAMM|nr:alkaline phosphatase [Photobacterium lipolyticum]PSW06190.1 alkaline phosphatase [Photobacterium lipolyticum]
MEITLLRIVLIISVTTFIFKCGDSEIDSVVIPPAVTLKAKNIIIFIGDGMGDEHRKAARLVKVGGTGKLSMDNMPTSGYLQTHSSDNLITDSAAAATALATGVKTNNGVIGLDANLGFVPTILEDAKKQDKLVGLVTTVHITHATPAAFYSHVENRDMMKNIALQMLNADIDVLLGGGEDEFLPRSENGCYPEAGEREDGRNLIQEAISIGYTYVCDLPSFRAIDTSSSLKLLGLFGDEGMIRPFSPSLAEMTQSAIDILSKKPNGFFLMVEGGQIDWASHNNDAANAISDTIDFDEAVEVAKKFSFIDRDTLIIVTADHETGGMSVSPSSSGLASEDGPFSTADGSVFYVNWSTKGHTEVNVPITSQGPGSERLSGVHDNTFVHSVMHGALSND